MKHYERKSYAAWNTMHQLCTNPNTDSYKFIGALGIRVCEKWNDYHLFFSDMGEVPEGKVLGRIDKKKNFEPGNCRWVTQRDQANNRKSNRHLEFNGKTKTCAEWALEIGISAKVIHWRLKHGMPIHQVLSKIDYRKTLRR